MDDLRKKKYLWRGLILLVVGISALLLAGTEIYLRLSSPVNNIQEIYRHSPNPRIKYELRPQGSITFEGMAHKIPPTRIQISAYGLRDRDYSIPKGKAFRILVLGDSFTFGWGVNLEDTFAKKLEKILNEREGREFEVINLGVPGYNARQEIEFFKEKGLPLDPDLVLIGFHDNDFDPSYDVTRLPRLVPLFRHLYILRKMYLMYLGRLALRYHGHGSLANVMSVLKELDSIGAQMGFASALILFTKGSSQTRQLIGLCPQMGIRILDLTRFWRQGLLIPGDYHPTAEAHSIYAEEIYRFLKANDLLKKSNPGTTAKRQ